MEKGEGKMVEKESVTPKEEVVKSGEIMGYLSPFTYLGNISCKDGSLQDENLE